MDVICTKTFISEEDIKIKKGDRFKYSSLAGEFGTLKSMKFKEEIWIVHPNVGGMAVPSKYFKAL